MSQHPRALRWVCALAVVVPLVTSGCATGHLDEQNAVPMGNARPAASPDSTRPTEGAVVDLGGKILSVESLGGDVVGVQLAEPPRMVLGRVDGVRWREVATVDLPSDARTAGPGIDSVLVPYGDGYVVIRAGGEIDRRAGLGPVSSAAHLPTGQVLTGTDDGRVSVRSADGAEHAAISGVRSADQIVVAGDRLVVVSRTDTTVATIDTASEQPRAVLRAGRGAGRAAASAAGTMVVSDTVGDALMVYTMTPVRQHQLFPVGPTPWAVAMDPVRRLAWVTTTGDNRVLAYDLGSGLGTPVADLPTVRQPDSLVVTGGGTVVVGSASGSGLHLLSPIPVPTSASPAPGPGR